MLTRRTTIWLVVLIAILIALITAAAMWYVSQVPSL
jgi:hypothetical protein